MHLGTRADIIILQYESYAQHYNSIIWIVAAYYLSGWLIKCLTAWAWGHNMGLFNPYCTKWCTCPCYCSVTLLHIVLY